LISSPNSSWSSWPNSCLTPSVAISGAVSWFVVQMGRLMSVSFPSPPIDPGKQPLSNGRFADFEG
jgi:hypothetical protein